MITLYGTAGSPVVRKMLFALAVKELPFEHIQQIPSAGDEEYLKINPAYLAGKARARRPA